MQKIYNIYLNNKEVREEIDKGIEQSPTHEEKVEEVIYQVRFLQNQKTAKYFRDIEPLSMLAYEELTKMILDIPQAEEIE